MYLFPEEKEYQLLEKNMSTTLRLELHHINVDGGEATLVLVVDDPNSTGKDTLVKSVLIDAGATRSGFAVMEGYIALLFKDRFQVQRSEIKLDLFIATHYHNDHISGLKDAALVCKEILDVGEVRKNRTNHYAKYEVVEDPTDNKPVVDDYMVYVKEWKRIRIPFIETKNYELDGTLKKAFQKPVEINLDGQGKIKLYCVCAMGVLPNGKRILTSQRSQNSKDINFNDQSLALIIHWPDEKFSYFNAGDLTGDLNFNSYYHVEEELLDYMEGHDIFKDCFPFTIMKVNHHGSWFSNFPPYFVERDKIKMEYPGFLDRMKPEAIIHCCHLNLKDPLPHPTYMKDSLMPYLDERIKKNKKTMLVFANRLAWNAGANFNALAEVVGKKYQEHIVHNLVVEKIDKYTYLSNAYPIAVIAAAGRALPTAVSKADVDYALPGAKFTVRCFFNEELRTTGGTRVRPVKKSLYHPIPSDPLSYTFIQNGFKVQAKLITDAIKTDFEKKDNKGLVWYESLFPAWPQKVDLPLDTKTESLNKFSNDLFTQMEALWEIFFEKKYAEGMLFFKFSIKSEKATEELEGVIEPLLVRNPTQTLLNYLVYGYKDEDEFTVEDIPYGGKQEMKKYIQDQKDTYIYGARTTKRKLKKVDYNENTQLKKKTKLKK